MFFDQLKSGAEVSDETFDAIYPDFIAELAFTHFTPIEIAQKAVQFLVQKKGTKVLDIGSGAGKFCFIGAAITDGDFTGVEIRKTLHLAADKIQRKHQLSNVKFIHANITAIDFSAYQAFYFYNAFMENYELNDQIDQTITLKKDLYTTYSIAVKEKLAVLPKGTRLVTFYSNYDEVPASYKKQATDEVQKITMWEKVN